ncbi:MAG: poly-beta-1,6-N-acetyl-D-glucosamine biosynthesis protein PgaD [Castellaniella sp.]|uniref:Poly-beta-1,6-N-acetyl-D-glucosamine biosynthesis protein PgaD n=1 Tax=Castellaniella hirudinis TaxID=1144617 RepID=A0ABV8RUG7_9BURK
MMIVKTPRSLLASALDVLLTALAWAAFGFLFVSGVHAVVWNPAHAAADPSISRLLPDAQALLAYALIAACIGLLLSAWACYNALRFCGMDRRKPPGEPQSDTLAGHFDISLSQLQVLRASRTILIHHTDEGRISMIDFAHDPAFNRDVIPQKRQMKQI